MGKTVATDGADSVYLNGIFLSPQHFDEQQLNFQLKRAQLCQAEKSSIDGASKSDK